MHIWRGGNKMTDLKLICDKFDQTYELSGRKLNTLKAELKTLLETAYSESDDNVWIAWMYGQLFTGESMLPEIENKYIEFKNVMTDRNKSLSSTYHLTSMYDVIVKDVEE